MQVVMEDIAYEVEYEQEPYEPASMYSPGQPYSFTLTGAKFPNGSDADMYLSPWAWGILEKLSKQKLDDIAEDAPQ